MTLINKQGKSIEFIKKLNTMINAKMTAWIVSSEEEKFLKGFRKIAEAQKEDDDERFGIYTWSITEGLLNATATMIRENGLYKKPTIVTDIKSAPKNLEARFGNKVAESNPIPIVTFSDTYDFIMKTCSSKIFIIKDIHNLLDKNRQEYPSMVRRLKDLIFHTRRANSTIIFFSPVNRVPLDLETDIHVIEMPRPDEIDIEELLNTGLSDLSEVSLNIKFDIDYISKNKLIKSKHPDAKLLKEKLIMNLRGLTDSEISQIIQFVCVKNKALDEKSINEIKDAKKQIIEKNGVLTFIPVPSEIKVGGHEEFKKYIDSRGAYLNTELRNKYKLPAPKGVLLVGVSGAGKSLNARYIGYKWNIPLIRFNMDAVFTKYLGESEDNLRNALSIAEANSPCVLFLDEIDKGLGGIASSGDSGTGMRILGKILTWMQEREEMVFMFATANNVSKLPPELLRAGRFDAKFWADLPTLTECLDIFKIKCIENSCELSYNDYKKVARMAYDRKMTGAEIEHSILQALYVAASRESDAVTREQIEEVMSDIISHAETHSKELEEDRKLALKSYIFTSNEAKKRLESEFRVDRH